MPANPIDHRKTCSDPILDAVQPLPDSVRVGSRVQLRGAKWRLDALVPHADCRELHLFAVEAGARRVVLWPFDRPVLIDDRPRYTVVRLRTWCARVNAALAQAREPCSPRGRLIDGVVLPYQIAPAIAAGVGACRL